MVCSKICISAQKLITCHRFLRLEDFANVFLKSGHAFTINTQVTCKNTSPFGKVALNRARSHSNNVTVIARIQSDLTLRERLRTHKILTKDQCFYLNYHKFSIKSYVLDVY